MKRQKKLHHPIKKSIKINISNHTKGKLNTMEEYAENFEKIENYKFNTEVKDCKSIVIKAKTLSDKKSKNAALFKIDLFNSEGVKIHNENWIPISKSVGEYKYLKSNEPHEISTTEFTINLPENSFSINLSGVQWNPEVETLISPSICIQKILSSSSPHDSKGSENKYSASEVFLEQPLHPRTEKVDITVKHLSKNDSKSPITVTFIDSFEKICTPPSDLPQSPKLGPYFYLEGSKGNPIDTKVSLSVPKEARSIQLRGADWGEKTPLIIGAIGIEESLGHDESVQSFIEEIPEDDHLFIINTTAPPLGHKTLALRPNNLSLEYEKMGIWVIFIPFSSTQDQPKRFSRKTLQIDREEFDTLIDHALKQRPPQKSYFICSSFPSFQSLTTIYRLKTAGWNTVYECRDDMEEFNRVGYSKWYSPALEREVVRQADCVVSVSLALDKKLRTLVHDTKNNHVIPNAVNSSVIESSSFLRSKEAFLHREKSDIVGYVGHLTKSWFDWSLLIKAAQSLPEVTFQIVGHGAPDNLKTPINIQLLGPKTHEELQKIVCNWKTGIIPFLDIPLTRSVDPNKIYEYLAWGLRCVSAPMGMVERYPSTQVYYGLEDFKSSIKKSLETPYTEHEITTIIDFVSTCSWEDRAKKMCKIMGVEIKEGV